MARKPSAADAPLRLDNQICFAVYSAAHAFNRVYKPLLDPLGLTYPQYLAMLVLWEGDGVTVSQLGERLALDSGTLTPLLKRLEAQGLVRRLRDVADERRVLLQLTPAGRALKARALAVPAQIVRATGCALDEVASLTARLKALRGQINQSTTTVTAPRAA